MVQTPDDQSARSQSGSRGRLRPEGKLRTINSQYAADSGRELRLRSAVLQERTQSCWICAREDGRLSGITNFQSGQSTTVTQGSDPFATPANNNSGLNMARGATAQLRTDLIGDPHGPKTAAEFFNTAAFAVAVRTLRWRASGHRFGTRVPTVGHLVDKEHQLR